MKTSDPRLATSASPAREEPVLAVDLDGTLLRTDVLYESFFNLLTHRPLSIFKVLAMLLVGGKARFKRSIAKRVELDSALLPYDEEVVAWLTSERTRGRRIVLCTASDAKYAQAIAAHLQLFDDVLASDGHVNNKAAAKAELLVARYGEKGFDYAGNDHADVPVWSHARHAIVVAASPAVHAAAGRVAPIARTIARERPAFASWRRALRLHQWTKNVLVFLPLFGAHQMFRIDLLARDVAAFVAFSFCASSVYLLNDLIDLESDRRHRTKRHRPFAAGRIPLLHGALACAALLVASFTVAIGLVNWMFTGWLVVYLATTLSYTFWLKRKMLLDSVVLAALYTLRVLAGSAAAGIETGFWLLALAMFLFLSLAMIKRYSELESLIESGERYVPGRGYRSEDLHLVQSFGVASGFAAVVVLALYNNGETVARLYPHQQVVWLTVPILLYWICRLWLRAHRGDIRDDPVAFALTDRISLVTIGTFVLTLLVATIPW